MDKSFGYIPKAQQFRIARHQVGDFGLHLSLIRSFSWGNNFPPESPFFPGQPLPYHYYFDLAVGLLERLGLRIDLCVNGLSVIAFTSLLFLIYQLSQLIFGKNKVLGLTSVLLFLFSSSLSFLDFFKGKIISLSLLKELWLLPDYLHLGPFDGSLISTFFTPNVFLNQRHLIAGLSLSLSLIYYLLNKLKKSESISAKTLFFLGIILGFSSRIHTLIFLSTTLILFLFCLSFKRLRLLLWLFLPAIFISSFHFKIALNQDLSHPFFNPGFLAPKPLTVSGFALFWFLNFGLACFTIPFGFFLTDRFPKKIFLCVLPLFLLGNFFQFGFRPDHNHSLFNLFFIFANFYSAYFLIWLWQKNWPFKLLFFVFLFSLTFSGLINLMAVKNDFQLMVDDAPKNEFMEWIKTETKKEDIFLAQPEILDPVTLSGRKNYLGAQYYLEVMGYNFTPRSQLVKTFFEAQDSETIAQMKKENIKYLVIPLAKVADFNYQVNKDFLQENLEKAYQDEEVIVFQL